MFGGLLADYGSSGEDESPIESDSNVGSVVINQTSNSKTSDDGKDNNQPEKKKRKKATKSKRGKKKKKLQLIAPIDPSVFESSSDEEDVNKKTIAFKDDGQSLLSMLSAPKNVLTNKSGKERKSVVFTAPKTQAAKAVVTKHLQPLGVGAVVPKSKKEETSKVEEEIEPKEVCANDAFAYTENEEFAATANDAFAVTDQAQASGLGVFGGTHQAEQMSVFKEQELIFRQQYLQREYEKQLQSGAPVPSDNVALPEEAKRDLERMGLSTDSVSQYQVSGNTWLSNVDPRQQEELRSQAQVYQKRAQFDDGFGDPADPQGRPAGVSVNAKRKHQVTFLAADFRRNEMALKEAASKNKLTKRQTQAKYGW
eukprot:GCRY01004109.1.p1 GENE.GCRY01004109.1~~GCRY01004109.1.p1  ORF type:complete len:367 (-),score=96.45 GCRY01004109.1:29-1129(-)